MNCKTLTDFCLLSRCTCWDILSPYPGLPSNPALVLMSFCLSCPSPPLRPGHSNWTVSSEPLNPGGVQPAQGWILKEFIHLRVHYDCTIRGNVCTMVERTALWSLCSSDVKCVTALIFTDWMIFGWKGESAAHLLKLSWHFLSCLVVFSWMLCLKNELHTCKTLIIFYVWYFFSISCIHILWFLYQIVV